MAFIANTAFETKVTNHEFDSVANITGMFVDEDVAPQDCSAGQLCVKATPFQNEGYPTGVLNGNSWYMMAASDSVTEANPIYACNPFNVQQIGDGQGNVYKVGHRTLGLGIPAGERDTFTQIHFDGAHIYRFGIGNLTADPGDLSTATFLNLDADGMLTPGNAPTTTRYFRALAVGTFTEGASESFGYVDALACYDPSVGA